MTQVEEGYRNLTEDSCTRIINKLKTLKKEYQPRELDEVILPNVAQWLYDVYVDKESTCFIISSTTNINRLQKTIDGVYDGTIPPLPAKSKLMEFLSNKEFDDLVFAIEPKKREGIVKGEIDDITSVLINFKTKQVYQSKDSGKKDIPPRLTPVIEAVPKQLTVYDALLLDQPRTFKILWESNVTNRVFATSGESTGATIQEIEQYLANAGFSHSPRLLGGALSCMVNTMIKEGLAEIKQDIDNPGFYYDVNKDKITTVKKEVSEPTYEEMVKAKDTLEDLTYFFKDNCETLATVFKWGLMSEFSYCMKQAGKWMPWMYLKGAAGSGKTTLAKVVSYIWGVPTPENNFGGSSFDTVARLGAKISQSCDPIIVNEPAAVFNRHSTNEMIKVCVESTTARSKYKGSYFGGIPAFSAVLFTANQYLPEDDALIRRLYVLSFSYSQRKSEHEKKMFEEAFHINTPTISQLVNLNVFGRFVAREIISNPGLLLDDWQDTADLIVGRFYDSIGCEVPSWLNSWAESENLEDFDDTQREDIRNFFTDVFNQARKKVRVYDDYGNNGELTLDIDGASSSDDFSSVNWGIINNRMVDWAIPHISRRGSKYVCLTQGLRKAISERIDFCSDLKSIGELLGWDYKNVKLNGTGKQMKVVQVRFDDFMEFLYPNIELGSGE